MKKTFKFTENEEKYMLINTNPNEKGDGFVIAKKDMKFDTNKFYKYVFADIKENMDIEIIDEISEDSKAAKIVLKTIKEITEGVNEKIKSICFK